MATDNPHFDGYFEIALNETSNFIESEEPPTSFTIWFYRRESENVSLDQFLSSITINNFGWDDVTKQLYFKSKDEELYSVNFTKIDS